MPKTILPAPPFTSFRGARSLSKTMPLVLFFRFSPFAFCTFDLRDYALTSSGQSALSPNLLIADG